MSPRGLLRDIIIIITIMSSTPSLQQKALSAYILVNVTGNLTKVFRIFVHNYNTNPKPSAHSTSL